MDNLTSAICDIPGVEMTLRLCLPDHSALHLRIKSLQMTTYYVLPLDADHRAVERALIMHVWAMVAAAGRN